MIDELVPNSNAANSPIAKAVFRAIAFILKGNNNIKDYYESVGFYLSEEGWNIIKSKGGNLVEEFQNYVEYVRDLSIVLPNYIAQTDGMTDEDFSKWVDDNREAVEQMEDVFGYNISEPEDLMTIYLLVDADQLSKIMWFEIDAVSTAKLLTAIGELWVYAYGVGGIGGAMDAISHGHMPASYVWWINSMYCGYYGWKENAKTGAAILDEGIHTIGNNCFSGTLIKGIYGIEELRYISSYGFYNCAELKSVVLPNGVKILNDYSFTGCTSLETLVIPDSVAFVGYKAFYNCSALKEVTVPGDVEYSDYAPFTGCGIEKVTYTKGTTGIIEAGDHNSWYPKSIAQTCASTLKEVVMGEGITEIEQYVFSERGTKNNDNSYRACIERVTWPSTLITIGDYAFQYQDNLTELHLPENVTEIGEYAFANCAELTDIYLTGDAPSIKSNSFSSIISTAYYPSNNSTWTENLFQNYGGTITWMPWNPSEIKLYENTLKLPENTTKISSEAFAGLIQGVNIDVPATVTIIEDDAFNGSAVVIISETGDYVEQFCITHEIPFYAR